MPKITECECQRCEKCTRKVTKLVKPTLALEQALLMR